MRVVLALLAASVAPGQVLVIRNVTVIDADGPRPNRNVAIRSGRITSEGRTAAPISGATIVEGKGKFLIPGLWDMHVHLSAADPMTSLYVAAGVAGVRDMGSDLTRTRRVRSEILAGSRIGPRIYTSGPMLDSADSRTEESAVIRVSNPQQARDAVDSIERSSADFIKILSGLSSDEYQSVAQRARVIRMPFAGHLPDSVSALDAVDARQKSIEHMFGIPIACSPLEPSLRKQRAEALGRKDTAALEAVQDRIFATFSAGAANDLFHRMARFGVYQTPTLTLWQRMTFADPDRLATAADLKFVPEPVRKSWKDPRKESGHLAPEKRVGLRKEYEFYSKLAKFMLGSGVSVLAGTDTGDPYVVPGFALHDELEAMVEAGYTPQEALNSATVVPARYFDSAESFGSIGRGKIADLVLLESDPLADIRNTRKISAVVLNGRLLNRKCLDGLLEGKTSVCPSVPLKVEPVVAPRIVSKRRAHNRYSGL